MTISATATLGSSTRALGDTAETASHTPLPPDAALYRDEARFSRAAHAT